jgi:ABC-type amino acid transport substrate-binding protein
VTQASVVTVGVDASPPPPLCFGLPDTPDFRGFEVDLLGAIAATLGVTLRYRSARWSEAFAELQAGRLDMICSAATITAERRNIVAFSDPYLEAELALIVRHDSLVRRSEDLRDRTIGVRVATVAEAFVRERCHPGVVHTFHLNVDAYQALGDGVVEAVVDDRPIADHFARSVEGLRPAAPIAGTGFAYGIVFARGNDGLRDAVNRALADLKADGTWERFCLRWFPRETAP